MTETQKITLEHRQAVEELRQKYGHELSSHAFASLYLWRDQMGLSLLLEPELFAVRCIWQGPGAWFFPCGDEAAREAFIKKGLAEPDFSLCYLRNCDAAWLEAKFPGRWKVSRTPDADEYIYDREGHRQLAGGKYSNMRTQVHKVEREYKPAAAVLGEENMGDALAVLRQWSHGARRFEDCGISDDQVDKEALLQHRELGITGVILYLDGTPTAVTAGFALTENIFDVMVAKSISTAQGVSYYAKRELFCISPCPFINMEEDLGIQGLRKMKNGMNPTAKNEVWKAVRL